jgi:hypothetical protein
MLNKQILERLKHLAKAETDSDVKEFGSILESVSEGDREFLPKLFLLLNDDCDCDAITWPIIHAVELFECSFYAKTLLNGLKDFYCNSKFWIERLFSRMFNDDSDLKAIKENIHLADKGTLLMLLDYLENNEPLEQHRPIIAELRKLANQ